MNINGLASLLFEDVKTIEVQFSGEPKRYVYKTLDNSIVEGDSVVVLPPKGLSIARVCKVHTVNKIDLNAPYSYKWIVSKVDTTQYNQLIEKEEAFEDSLRVAQQKAVVNNAKEELMLQLGIDEDTLNESVKLLSVEKK